MIRLQAVSRKTSGKVVVKRPTYVPGFLVAQIKEDVVAKVRDVKARAVVGVIF